LAAAADEMYYSGRFCRSGAGELMGGELAAVSVYTVRLLRSLNLVNISDWLCCRVLNFFSLTLPLVSLFAWDKEFGLENPSS
jgi:hypothetical protein